MEGKKLTCYWLLRRKSRLYTRKNWGQLTIPPPVQCSFLHTSAGSAARSRSTSEAWLWLVGGSVSPSPATSTLSTSVASSWALLVWLSSSTASSLVRRLGHSAMRNQCSPLCHYVFLALHTHTLLCLRACTHARMHARTHARTHSITHSLLEQRDYMRRITKNPCDDPKSCYRHADPNYCYRHTDLTGMLQAYRSCYRHGGGGPFQASLGRHLDRVLLVYGRVPAPASGLLHP